jgi:tRNA(Ile)-lysidine synthase TilS/MesJ
VIFQPYSGRHLCRDHLVSDIEARIKRDIRKNRWMQPGDHLAVALSGDTGSRALLAFFHRLTARRRDIRLSAIIIDEGAGWRGPAKAGEYADTLGVGQYHGSFAGTCPLTTGGIRQKTGSGSPCSRCRELRCDLIETIALREGITRVLSERTLDDRAAGILGHILRGTAEVLFPDTSRQARIPWADPLGSVPQKEIDLYAEFVCPGTGPAPRPSRETGFSPDVADLLETYSRRHPATPYSVSGIGDALAGAGCNRDRSRPEGP